MELSPVKSPLGAGDRFERIAACPASVHGHIRSVFGGPSKRPAWRKLGGDNHGNLIAVERSCSHVCAPPETEDGGSMVRAFRYVLRANLMPSMRRAFAHGTTDWAIVRIGMGLGCR